MSLNLTTKTKKLDKPTLEEVKKAFIDGLKDEFSHVKVEIVDCPDLTAEPFKLKCKGLGGSTALLDIGGPPYLLPYAHRDKVYDLKDMSKIIGLNECFIIGAGAGPWPYAGTNCEMIANAYIKDGNIDNGTVISKVVKETDGIEVEFIPKTESRFALLANLYASEGKPSKVLKVDCKKRIGKENFVSAMRTTLQNTFKGKYVGLGGAFIMKSGKAKQHIMPDFSQNPLHTEEDLNGWLKFYEMSAPLVAVGTLISEDIPNFDLRVQHFHSFSHHGEAGHYHCDVTPDEVEYLAYLNLADYVYRIDQPVNSHQVGRD